MGVELWVNQNPSVIGNILRNTFGNTLRAGWEHDRNTVGTREKNTTNPPSSSFFSLSLI